MTAGSGLLHNEFFTGEFSRSGGIAQFVQLWVNLPKEYKMVEPRYQALTKERIPEAPFEGGVVRVIAGEFGTKK
jgi:quercetin 2,3-dioxygenase